VIKGSYIRMTMLDPHPATNYRGKVYYSAGVVATALTAKGSYLAFQAVANDPRVVVPRAVNSVEVVAVHRCSSCVSQVRCARTTTLANGQLLALLTTVPVCHHPAQDEFRIPLGMSSPVCRLQDVPVRWTLHLSTPPARSPAPRSSAFG
jgi:hypothetical protein